MFQAQGSNVEYGSSICSTYLNSLGDYILITHKEPWELIQKNVTNQPKFIIEAKELSKKYLDDLANEVPTSKDPINPGPLVKEIACRFSLVMPACSMAC